MLLCAGQVVRQVYSCPLWPAWGLLASALLQAAWSRLWPLAACMIHTAVLKCWCCTSCCALLHLPARWPAACAAGTLHSTLCPSCWAGLQVAEEMGKGLEALHSRGIVHRCSHHIPECDTLACWVTHGVQPDSELLVPELLVPELLMCCTCASKICVRRSQQGFPHCHGPAPDTLACTVLQGPEAAQCAADRGAAGQAVRHGPLQAPVCRTDLLREPRPR